MRWADVARSQRVQNLMPVRHHCCRSLAAAAKASSSSKPKKRSSKKGSKDKDSDKKPPKVKKLPKVRSRSHGTSAAVPPLTRPLYCPRPNRRWTSTVRSGR